MTSNKLTDDPIIVARDARALATYIKARGLRVISAGVRPDVEVTFFSVGLVTEQFIKFAKPLSDPTFTTFRSDDSVWLRAKGGFSGSELQASIIAGRYEAQLLCNELPSLGEAKDQAKVPLLLESLTSALAKMHEHADDCDLTCQQYGQVPCYATRAL